MLHTRAHILGELSTQPRCGKDAAYFTGRDCWIDCRAPDCLVIHPECNLGWNIAIVTLSHDPRPGMFGRTYGMRTQIDAGAFVAGFCVLYNCHIGEGAVVAVGSVVRGQTVPAGEMWAGNPARCVARLVEGDWMKADQFGPEVA